MQTKVRRLLTQLGLVFGCLDFIVSPDGRHVFLEVNQAGQFLFVERDSGMPLLDAFSDFLLRGRTDFRWDEPRAPIRLQEVEQEVKRAAQRELRTHVRPTDRAIDERTCPSCLRPYRTPVAAAADAGRRGRPPRPARCTASASR